MAYSQFTCFLINYCSILLFNLITFPGIPHLSTKSGFVTSAWTLIHGNFLPPSFAKYYAKLSNLLSCSLTLSASPKASRVADNCMSFFSLSFSSSSLTQSPAWLHQFTVKASPLQQPFISLLCCKALCAVPQTKMPAGVLGASPYTCSRPQASNIQATVPCRQVAGQVGISPLDASFPVHIYSVSCLAC